jgi:LacI family transcriptional regulator
MRTRAADKRYLAYQQGLAESGLPPELIDLPGQDRATIRTFLRGYIQESGCPGAIFCHNDDAALAAYRALLDLDIRVPEDCALVGCDGIPDTEYLPVPITTIVQPYSALCETACQFLKRRIAEPDCPAQQATFAAVLEKRDSSRF